MSKITSLDALRTLYKRPKERSVKKQLTALDSFCSHYISLSPLIILSTSDIDGRQDASPRGGRPGFVQVKDAHTLLIPDWPGNNRLDTLENIVSTGRIGLMFMIPGFDEVLRVNGRAELNTDPYLLALCPEDKKQPKLVIVVGIEDAYLHCAKALMRARLWHAESLVPRTTMPTMGQMLKIQTASSEPAETREEMLERYKKEMY